MKTTIDIINSAMAAHPNAIVAFSGGGDSTVLLDIIYTKTNHRPPLIWTDSRMEYPDTREHIITVANNYKAELLIAEAPREPVEQWEAQGWPMLGKLAARKWSQKHRQLDFKCNVTECCRRMKIKPARDLMKKHGFDMQFTGTRGNTDDCLRGLRAIKDGSMVYVESDKLTICNPLTGWTDTMIKRYTERYRLPKHPAKARGALTIGCMFCGGGAQFDNSGFKVLRQTEPEQWRKFILDWKAGEVILAIKHDTTLRLIRKAIERLGGLEHLVDTMPWIFDYLRITPIPGYVR